LTVHKVVLLCYYEDWYVETLSKGRNPMMGQAPANLLQSFIVIVGQAAIAVHYRLRAMARLR